MAHPSRRGTLQCKYCGNDFSVPKSNSDQKYCASACKYADYNKNGWPRKNSFEKTCEICGKSFTVTPSSEDRRFCSQPCMLVWRGPVNEAKRRKAAPKLRRNCDWCGIEYEYGVWADGRSKFCSKTCRTRHRNATCPHFTSAEENAFAAHMRECGLSFDEQVTINGFVVDFFFPDVGVAVEYDGVYWHSLPSVIKRDTMKNASIKRAGFDMLRICSTEFFSDPTAVISKIKQKVGNTRIVSGDVNAL